MGENNTHTVLKGCGVKLLQPYAHFIYHLKGICAQQIMWQCIFIKGATITGT